MERTPILYDVDCGFCRASVAAVLLWDRRGRLRPVALQTEEARQLLAGMDADEQMSAAHIVPPSGRPVSGGAIAAALLGDLPGGAPLALVARRVPGVARRTYAWVAGHRSQLSHLVPGWLVQRADAVIRRRSAGAPIPSR